MELPLVLAALHREIAVLYGAIARGAGLTLQQAELLFQLEHDTPSFGEMAVRLGCDKTNITGMVDRLAARGLVERRTDPHDRRVSRIGLTGAGTALSGRIRAEYVEAVQHGATTLAGEQEQLATLALRMATALAGHRASGQRRDDATG